ncbi:flagellar basal body FlgE domain-containing protein, partial [Oleiphilus sp. HI0043]|uniref:flagellar basal body FlgE domain-containing protein n=5 Tax=Oleiphilus TaxID=141450 RepID=UPI0026F448D4
MSISLNGISFQPAGATDALQLADLGTRINSSALVGVTAVIDSATGDLQIIQDQGANLVFGFAGVSGDSFEVLGSDAAATPVVLDPDAVPAVLNATVGGGVSIVLDEGVVATNLSASTPVITNFTGAPFVNNQFSPTDPGTYNHATSTTIFDSLGNSHVLTMYFVKQQSSLSGENTWQMHVQVDNQDVGD